MSSEELGGSSKAKQIVRPLKSEMTRSSENGRGRSLSEYGRVRKRERKLVTRYPARVV